MNYTNENARRQPGVYTQNSSATKYTGNPVDLLLARLDGARRTGKGWVAKCPAHEDKRASLSIAEGDDGRVLAHCFAGCRAADIVAAVGLELGDLFPRRFDASPLARGQRREYAQQAHVVAAAGILAMESRVVLIAAGELLADRPLNFDDYSRLAQDEQRITDARAVLA
jgi:hypothetical protein